MALFVDTSVWSLALRRDAPERKPEVNALANALNGGDAVVTTGLVLQELLHGFSGPRAREQIIERFSALPLLVPDRRDHIEAAELRNTCRRKDLQAGTVDALLAQLCVRHGLLMLTTDRDFHQAARLIGLRLWTPTTRRHCNPRISRQTDQQPPPGCPATPRSSPRARSAAPR